MKIEPNPHITQISPENKRFRLSGLTLRRNDNGWPTGYETAEIKYENGTRSKLLCLNGEPKAKLCRFCEKKINPKKNICDECE